MSDRVEQLETALRRLDEMLASSVLPSATVEKFRRVITQALAKR